MQADAEDNHLESWGSSNIQLHHLLIRALTHMKYTLPTKIQIHSIPITLRGVSDIVGAAETGSGKTLAFILPVLHTLLTNYREWHSDAYVEGYQRNIYGLIITPTRELAVQITQVAKEIPKFFHATAAEDETAGADVAAKSLYPIGILSLIGGLSEHKQKRQLFDGLYSKNPHKFVHLVICTPGRLNELLVESNAYSPNSLIPGEHAVYNVDTDIAALVASGRHREPGNEMLLLSRQHWRRLRYLIIDEADRLIDEGHFPELHSILDYIQPTVPKILPEEGMMETGEEGTVPSDATLLPAGSEAAPEAAPTVPRQTLLFSATCMKHQAPSMQRSTEKSILKWKKQARQAPGGRRHRRLVIRDHEDKGGKLELLSHYIQNLLLLTSNHEVVNVVDVTSMKRLESAAGDSAAGGGHTTSSSGNILSHSLPANILQYELTVPIDEKDLTFVQLLLEVRGSEGV